MLLCFAAGWPFSIYKSYTSRVNGGKSLVFLIIVAIGYVAGVIHKELYSFDKVIFLYILNGIMVIIDIMLYWRNARLKNQN
jgi:hypothetical protein